MRHPRLRAVALAAIVAASLAACVDKDQTKAAIEGILTGPPKPDSLPRMLNAEPPFRYPPALYEKKVQGNVSLRIYIDSLGRVWPESTLVVEPSGYPALDSAAVRGVEQLRFRPALRNGSGMAVAIIFPVFFRHPDAPALPGDTVLKPKDAASGGQGGTRKP